MEGPPLNNDPTPLNNDPTPLHDPPLFLKPCRASNGGPVMEGPPHSNRGIQ